MLGIDEIWDIFQHSIHCQQEDTMFRDPPVPLQPDLCYFALCLLRDLTPLSMLRKKCREWAEQKWGTAIGDDHYRFRLAIYDTSSLYCTIALEEGVPQGSTSEQNIHLWFNSGNPQPPPSCPHIRDSILHYQPYIPGVTERFEIAICTPNMCEAAWTFGHQHLVFMDLTFGLTSSKVLTLILMALKPDTSYDMATIS